MLREHRGSWHQESQLRVSRLAQRQQKKKKKGGLNVATVQRCSLVAGQDCKAALFARQRVFDTVADGEGANLQ